MILTVEPGQISWHFSQEFQPIFQSYSQCQQWHSDNLNTHLVSWSYYFLLPISSELWHEQLSDALSIHHNLLNEQPDWSTLDQNKVTQDKIIHWLLPPCDAYCTSFPNQCPTGEKQRQRGLWDVSWRVTTMDCYRAVGEQHPHQQEPRQNMPVALKMKQNPNTLSP